MWLLVGIGLGWDLGVEKRVGNTDPVETDHCLTLFALPSLLPLYILSYHRFSTLVAAFTLCYHYLFTFVRMYGAMGIVIIDLVLDLIIDNN